MYHGKIRESMTLQKSEKLLLPPYSEDWSYILICFFLYEFINSLHFILFLEVRIISPTAHPSKRFVRLTFNGCKIAAGVSKPLFFNQFLTFRHLFP
jgi:hypothetical protein